MVGKVFLVLFSIFVSTTICEDNIATGCARWYEVPSSKLDIVCPVGHVVSVTKAFYGYWVDGNTGICSHSRNDCTEDAMHVAVDACRGKTRCQVPVSTALVAHVLASALDIPRECASWNDRHDYLQVFYQCTEVPDDFVFTASSCTHFYTVNERPPHPILTDVMSTLNNHMDINCPEDKVISVRDAFYGWWKDNINVGCRFHSDDCRVDTGVPATLCTGNRSCRIPVRRSGNSPKCGNPVFELRVDHFDYLQVDYACSPERK